jgi:acyl-CoA synthetase (AMP-forming)/AMP-acid ligase II
MWRPARTWRPWSRSAASGWPISSCGTVGAVLFGGAETVQQVLAHCREQLADFKIPQYIVVSGRPLPRNPAGKFLKAQLRKSVEWGAPL